MSQMSLSLSCTGHLGSAGSEDWSVLADESTRSPGTAMVAQGVRTVFPLSPTRPLQDPGDLSRGGSQCPVWLTPLPGTFLRDLSLICTGRSVCSSLPPHALLLCVLGWAGFAEASLQRPGGFLGLCSGNCCSWRKGVGPDLPLFGFGVNSAFQGQSRCSGW